MRNKPATDTFEGEYTSNPMSNSTQNETHNVCNERLEREGGKATCCYCDPHEGCTLSERLPEASKTKDRALQEDWKNSHDFKQAVYAADKLLDEPYADPDDDPRTVARQFNRMVERYNALAKELADARKEVIKRIEAMPDKDVRPQITVWLESKEYCLGYNKALSNVLATLREEEGSNGQHN